MVELMIVIAILATLAAIALPRLMIMQYKAKRSEVGVIVPHLADIMATYVDATGDTAFALRTLPIQGYPVSHLSANKQRRDWSAALPPSWQIVNFRPDGATYGVYAVYGSGNPGVVGGYCNDTTFPPVVFDYYMAQGWTDVDDDNSVFLTMCCSNPGMAVSVDAGKRCGNADVYDNRY